MELIREKYLSKIRPHYNVDLIKVITGVRRCGKSVILNQIKDELICKGVKPSHIIYINFEDFEYETINNAAKLNEYIKQFIVDKEKYYIFLDEIQHVKDFERAIASFRATLNSSIFVTGSNSALLSGELATLLTGRTVEIEIMPFMFSEVKEYFDINNKIFSEEMFYDYLK